MKVLEVFEKNLRVKNYSKRTIETYSSYVKRYIREVNSLDPYQLTTKQLNEYFYAK